MIFDTDTNCFVLFNGTNWKNLCTGISGLTGPTGAAGAPGTAGVTGPTGATGAAQPASYNISFTANPSGTLSITDGGGTLTTTQGAWLTSGNAGTTAGTNFAGTTDAQDFVLKSNNNEVLRTTTTGAVGINQPTPAATAILDIQSTTKGVLFPALTTTQISAIAAPALGLTVYNTSINVHQFWNGTCWVNVGQTVCSFDYALSQSHTADCLLKTNFNSVSDTLTVSLVSGTASPVILSAAGVPAGILVNFSNNYLVPTQTSVMTFTALPSAANGTYTITVLATSGSTVRTLTYTLTVYDFGLALGATTGTVNQINLAPSVNTTTTTIVIGNPGACSTSGSTAALTATNVPAGVNVSFASPNIAVPGNTTMTITATCAALGTYTIYVNATIGATATQTPYILTVAPSVINITTSAQNINLFNLAGAPSCPVTITFNIASGVTIGSSSTAGAALSTGAFAGGSSITINNSGDIIGAGGKGGDDFNHNLAVCNFSRGGDGGTAIDLGFSGTVINNSGTIGGGGGGGGAGEELSVASAGTTFREGGGGGGGAGSIVGSGSTGSGCNNGTAGTLTTGGPGGGSCSGGNFLFTDYSGGGGAGGNLGQPGNGGGGVSGTGATGVSVCGAGQGGNAGFSIDAHGNSYTLGGAALLGPINP